MGWNVESVALLAGSCDRCHRTVVVEPVLLPSAVSRVSTPGIIATAPTPCGEFPGVAGRHWLVGSHQDGVELREQESMPKSE
jgi:hypothetical protein